MVRGRFEDQYPNLRGFLARSEINTIGQQFTKYINLAKLRVKALRK